MTYLDVNPMIDSLSAKPEDFSLKRGVLLHRGSRHSFAFDSEGKVQIMAACECALLQIKPEQERSLYESFRAWEARYWRPLRTNREFASHFRRRSWRGTAIRLATRLASWLAEERTESEHSELPSFSNG